MSAKMKKSHFLRFGLICLITVSLMVFARGICEDEDSALDMVCNTTDAFWYVKFFVSILSYSGIVYEFHDYTIAPTPILAYLERHEKSPPA